jgi:hypothetical protein
VSKTGHPTAIEVGLMIELMRSLRASGSSRLSGANNNQQHISILEQRSNVQLSEPFIERTRGLSPMANVP